jgi:DNA-binding IscR family transcriptional regulator
VIDTLMPDLVGHDKQPSAFIVYLYLAHRAGRRAPVQVSLQAIAMDTGLSKSAVQKSLRTLKRRKLVDSVRESDTAVTRYVVLRPWVARRA